ncbi:MAG: HAD family hydrolase [Actinomycetota bacterium]
MSYHARRLAPSREPLSWSRLAALVEALRPHHLSVDVFDTCVVRDLLGDHAIERVADLRAGVRGTPGRRETAEKLEERLCRPVPEVVSSLQRIRAAGTTVRFVSDTERSSASLIAMLSGLGIFAEGDDLVSSDEWGATKARGDLLPLVWSKELAAGEVVWHIGDHLWSDVAMAEQAGIRAFHVAGAVPTRYERIMAGDPTTAGPAVAAAARRARLAIEAERSAVADARNRRIEVLGADIAGQVLGAFLLWLADKVRTERLSHLVFLARDGELPLLMARAMPDDHWDVPLTYAHCSRRSWAVAGDPTTEEGAERRARIVDYLHGLNLRPGRIGVVDVGWSGGLASLISPLVAEVTGQPPLHLHFGGTQTTPEVEAKIDVARFAMDGGDLAHTLLSPVVCVETLTASGKARVTHYERQADNTVAPVFARRTVAVDNPDRELLWDGALRVAKAFPSRAELAEFGCTDNTLQAETVEVLRQWWHHPTRKEADAMTGLGFESDDDGRLISPLLAPYSVRQLWSATPLARQWRHGSAVISPWPVSKLLRLLLDVELVRYRRRLIEQT